MHDSTVLSDALQHILSHPGRALRPQLVFAAQEATGSPDEDKALILAQAIELIHISSLIYDDLPCMDDSPFRRGYPTLHRMYGEAIAILTADSLKSLAFEQLCKIEGTSHTQFVRALFLLSQSSGYSGICLGQSLDLDQNQDNTEEELLEIYHLKTGSLIEASVLLGTLVQPETTESEWAGLSRYAKNLGIAFQIINDLNDSSSFLSTGKIPKQDQKHHKKTLLSCRGRRECAKLALDFIDCCQREITVFSKTCTRLEQILFWTKNQLPVDCTSHQEQHCS